MSESTSRLEMMYHSGIHVKRLHTIPTVAQRSTAEHVYGALCVARELCLLNAVDPGRVMVALLFHDSPEVHTGDMPANIKLESKPLADELDRIEQEFHEHFNTGITLNETEERIVKAADNLDFMFTCLNELRMGNRHPFLKTVFRRSSAYIKRHYDLPGVAALAEYIHKEWSNV